MTARTGRPAVEAEVAVVGQDSPRTFTANLSPGVTVEDVREALGSPPAEPVPPSPVDRPDLDTRTVVERLIDVMGEVGAIEKGRQVTEGPARYAYRGIEDVQAALQRLLVRHRVLILPSTLQRIDHPPRQTRAGTAMYAVALHVEFTAYGPAGDTVTMTAWGEGADTGDKASGKAHSMAYKTAMLEAFCVPTERDTVDGDTTSPEVTFTEEQRDRAGRAWQAALAAPDLPALAGIRNRAQALLEVPVEVDGQTAPLGERLTGRARYLQQQGDTGTGRAGGERP